VTGGGSSWTSSGALKVGDLGQGRLTVVNGGVVGAGTYAQNAASTLEVVLGPATGDVVTVTGAATIDGTFEVSLQDGFAPPAGTTYDALRASGISGSFDDLVVGAGLEVDVQSTRVLVTVTDGGDPCPEDIDGNGTVDVADLVSLLAAWGPCGGCPEDIDGSGTVDTADLVDLLAAWGKCP
jgi:hypothetical protein